MTFEGRSPELVQQACDGVVVSVWTVNLDILGLFQRSKVMELSTVGRNGPVAANTAHL